MRKLTLIIPFLFQVLFVFSQTINRFPNNINISDFESCSCSLDSGYVHFTVADIDFGDYRMSYDISTIKLADINFDNSCEVIHIFSSSARGWPHDYISIYQIEQDSSISKIGDFPGYLLSFAESDGKYLQINLGSIKGSKTNPIYYNTVYRYDGQKYNVYYSPQLTKEDFRQAGLRAYNKSYYDSASVYFQNALLTPHHVDSDILHDANNLAISLIQLGQAEKVIPLLDKYIPNCKDKNELAAAYYNLGLANEQLGRVEKARSSFELACKYKRTSACEKKLKKYTR